MSADAETIYRCKVKGGSVSIQNHPCEIGSPLAVRHLETPRYNPDAAARSRAIKTEMERRNAAANQDGYGSPRYRGPTESERSAAACQAAKNRRELMLKTAGMRRNFNLLRTLDQQVYAACR